MPETDWTRVQLQPWRLAAAGAATGYPDEELLELLLFMKELGAIPKDKHNLADKRKRMCTHMSFPTGWSHNDFVTHDIPIELDGVREAAREIAAQSIYNILAG